MTEARPTTHGTGPAAPGRRPDPPRPSTHPPSGPHPLPRQPDAAADHDGADGRGQAYAAPARAPLADARGPREPTTRLTSHGCWYPSADPGGDWVAFICDRGGVPQLWAGPVAGDDVRLLDAGPDPVREVSWSPDGRWIAYTTAPGGGEHTRVLCVRPDGTDRHILAGAEPGTSAYLGCWAHDGSALAVTVAVPTAPYAAPVTVAAANGDTEGLPAGWSSRDGTAVLLGAGARYDTGTTTPAPAPTFTTLAALADQGEDQHGAGTSPGFADGLSAYLLDPDGIAAPVLLATEADAATLRVCDLSRDGSFALLRRGPRGRREAVVVRTADATPTYVVPVADGDPWIGRFSPRADTLWLRSNAHREFAALIAATLDAEGHVHGWSVAAERDGSDLELLGFGRDGRTAVLAWNVGGATELEVVDTPARAAAQGPPPPERPGRCRCRTRSSPGSSRRAAPAWCWPCPAPSAAPASGGWPAAPPCCAPPGRPGTRTPYRRAAGPRGRCRCAPPRGTGCRCTAGTTARPDGTRANRRPA